MTPPAAISSRARYQIAGALNPRWGSLASRVPPEAERLGAAAHALEAPARATGLKGDRGCAGGVVLATYRGLPGASCAYSGRAAMPEPGASGKISDKRSGSGSTKEVRARITSASRWPESCRPISLTMATESAGRHGAIGALNIHISGAPRPKASLLI